MMKSSFPKSETCERREKTFQKILKWQLPQNLLRCLNSWWQMLWDMHLLLSTVVLLTVLNVRVDNLWGNIATKTLSDHHLSFYLPNVMQYIINVEMIFKTVLREQPLGTMQEMSYSPKVEGVCQKENKVWHRKSGPDPKK